MSLDLTSHLAGYQRQDGVYLISPPQSFDGGEAEYDAHIGRSDRDDALRSGQGAWELANYHSKRTLRAVLELGAGGGTCSLGLIAAASEAEMLITDTSLTFLQIIRKKLMAFELVDRSVHLATLAGERLSALPPGSMDAIIVASALHHVSDWRKFLFDAAALLRHGGVLAVQEPCREGNLMMGLALDFVLSPFWPSASLDITDAAKVTRCRDSIYLLADSTVEKRGEDKHSFLVPELIAAADKAGFQRSIVYSNRHFHDLQGTDLSRHNADCSITEYLYAFLEHHHKVSRQGLKAIREFLFPVMRRLDERFRAGDGVPLFGSVVFQR